MSGTTIRDVVIKIAIEMASSNVRMPSGFNFKDMGTKAGKEFGEDFYKAVSEAAAKHQAIRDPFVQPVGPYGPPRPGSSDEVFKRLDAIRKERILFEEELPVLQRYTQGIHASVKAKEAYVRITKEGVESTLQFVRGAALLGASLGEDTTKWLKFAAAAQGGMDVLNSMSALFVKVPGPLKVPAGIAAGLLSPLIAARADARMREADITAFRGTDGDISMRALNAVFNRSREGAGFGGWAAGSTNEIQFQARGLMGNTWRWADQLSRDVIGADAAGDEVTRRQLLRNAQLSDARMRQGRRFESWLTSSRGTEQGQRLEDEVRFGMGGMSAFQRLDAFDARAAAFRGRLDEREKILQRDRTRDPMGPEFQQLRAERGTFELQTAKERLQLLREGRQELERERQILLENSRLAHAQLDLERERLKVQQDRLGRAGGDDVLALRRIAGKIQSGEDFNRRDAEIAERFGVGGDKAAQFFQREFERNFTPEQREALTRGQRQQVGFAEENAHRADMAKQAGLPEIEDELAKVDADNEKIIGTLKDLFESELKFREELKEKLEELRDDQERTRKDLEKGGVRQNAQGGG